nr:Ser-rich [Cotesia vestalis bracovirus]
MADTYLYELVLPKKKRASDEKYSAAITRRTVPRLCYQYYEVRKETCLKRTWNQMEDLSIMDSDGGIDPKKKRRDTYESSNEEPNNENDGHLSGYQSDCSEIVTASHRCVGRYLSPNGIELDLRIHSSITVQIFLGLQCQTLQFFDLQFVKFQFF